MVTVEMIILWHEHKPVALYFIDRLIWETRKEIPMDDVLIDTRIVLPFNEAIRFAVIFSNGANIDTFKAVKEKIEKRIAELVVLEEKHKTLNLDVNLDIGGDW